MVSYIIPYVDGREKQFLINLESLERQYYKDHEIIVVYQDEAITNPSMAFNFGAKEANGDILCLTSPEVMNAETNVMYMTALPLGVYWIGRVVECEIDKIPKEWDRHNMTKVKPTKGPVVADCTEDTWAPWKYFLGVIHKKDYFKVGGMDETFMEGIAWEDRDFSERALSKLRCSFNPTIVGLHLTHSRKYQDENPWLRKVNRKQYLINYNNYIGRIYEQH